MKRFNKKFILIILLSGIFLMTGCDKINFGTFDASDGETTSDITLQPNKEKDNGIKKDGTNTSDTDKTGNEQTTTTSGDSSSSEASASPTPAIQPTANMDLSVYTVDAESGDIKLVTALIPEGSEITPLLIVETVLESMEDQSIFVGIKDVTTKGDSVIVNFDKDKTPYKNMGSGYEAAILDAIAQSLIDNLDNYSKVIYRVDGKSYESGVFELGIDEVYLGDN